MSAEDTSIADAGISQETHSRVATELADAQKQLAMLRAKTDMYDNQKREALTGMKDDVTSFIKDIHGSSEFEVYKHELAPMSRWAAEMEKGDSLETSKQYATKHSIYSGRLLTL